MFRPALIGVIVFFLIGLGLLTGAVFSAQSNIESRRRWESHTDWVRTEGVIESVDRVRQDDGDYFYRGVLGWSGPDGGYYSQTVTSGSSTISRGDTRPIRYNPRNPTESEPITPPVSGWFLTVILGVMGTVFALIPVKFLFSAHKSTTSTSPTE